MMFGGRRRRYGRGGGGGGGMGMLFLGMQLLSFFSFLSQSDRFFPVTLGVMALNIVTYLRPRGIRVHWPSPEEACISVQRVLFRGDWKRLFTSPFVHGSDYHLYFNMASFMWKAVTLERHFGSGYFAYMVSVFTMATGITYLAIHYLMAEFLNQWSAIQSCAVGFSAVIFALKVVTTHMEPPGMTLIMGIIPVPMRLACWVELVVISVLFPNVSFVGHLSGILVGLAYVWGPLKAIMDIPISMANTNTGGGAGFAINSYTYRAAPTGVRGNGGGSGRGRGMADRGNSEEEELQAAIRSSLQNQGQQHENVSLSAPRVNRGGSLDRDLQIALDRSIHDRGPNSSPPNGPPPPFNPAYPPPTDTQIPSSPGIGWSRDVLPSSSSSSASESERAGEEEEAGGLRQRHVATKEDETDMDTIRAARLRRFERTQ